MISLVALMASLIQHGILVANHCIGRRTHLIELQSQLNVIHLSHFRSHEITPNWWEIIALLVIRALKLLLIRS